MNFCKCKHCYQACICYFVYMCVNMWERVCVRFSKANNHTNFILLKFCAVVVTSSKGFLLHRVFFSVSFLPFCFRFPGSVRFFLGYTIISLTRLDKPPLPHKHVANECCETQTLKNIHMYSTVAHKNTSLIHFLKSFCWV